eukprot:scaffold1227_cov111-Isochrysis_galbana.AAC.4
MVVGKFYERFARLRADQSCREAKARRGGFEKGTTTARSFFYNLPSLFFYGLWSNLGCSLAVTPTGLLRGHLGMNRSRDRPSPLAWASHISAHTSYGCTSWNLRRGALLIIAVATAKGTHVRVLSCTALYSPTAQACKSGRRVSGLRMALARSRLRKVRENAFNSLSTCTKDGVLAARNCCSTASRV